MNIVLKIAAFAVTALVGAVCGAGVAVSKMNKVNNAPAEQPSSPDNTAETTTGTSTSSEATE